MRWSMCFFIIVAAAAGGCAQEWHHPLYLGNGDVWRQRIAVEVRSNGNEAAQGAPVSLKVGTGAGEAQLAGAAAEAVRVCDANGTELLFAITGPDGQLVKGGPVPAGSTFTLPVECPAGGTTRYYLYFDNPSAWAVPDFLDPTARTGPAADALHATASAPEAINLAELGANAPWSATAARPFRVPIPVINVTSQPQGEKLIAVYLVALRARLGLLVDWNSSVLVDDTGRAAPFYRVDGELVFPASAPAHTRRTYYLYFNSQPQETDLNGTSPGARQSYAAFLESRYNLVQNPSFEQGGAMPDGWTFNAKFPLFRGIRPGLDEPGPFGRRCARTEAPADMGKRQPGWKQEVAIQGGRSYLYAAWIRCRGAEGGLNVVGETQNAEGKPSGGARATTTLTPPVTGDVDWTPVFKVISAPADCTTLEMRLFIQEAGTVWHDGIVLAQVEPTLTGAIEAQPGAANARLTAWPINALVKVFRDARPPATAAAVRLTCARNEKEPLQVAVRAPMPVPGVEVEASAPQQAGGGTLPPPTVGVVGYTHIDYPSNTYSERGLPWHRMFPYGTPSSDGFPGLWPDPILPQQRFDLPAEQTQPVWLTFDVPEGATAGDYTGTVRFKHDGEVLTEVPYTLHVWDFALPTTGHLKAVYGRRGKDPAWNIPGMTDQQRYEALWKLMADHRVCPTIVEPEPQFHYEGGKVTVDFTDFDKAAEYYFNELHMLHAFTPFSFYGFGWGFPPWRQFEQTPYLGAFPYPGVDRSRLNPAYKEAYQACLRVFLDHLKQKGWYDKFTMYVADEPHYWDEDIRVQMKALTDMVHEVDPNLPIYSSTWKYVPEWDHDVTIWGFGHYGLVPERTMREVQAGGAKVWWTVDGQMCIDTPYLAIERLLPYYCFRYGAGCYEYYAIDQLLGDDPYQFGFHHFTPVSVKPGEEGFQRVHDGGGYLLYPSHFPDHPGPVTTIRLEQVREGLEDYEYMYLLSSLTRGRNDRAAGQALGQATSLVPIPAAQGLESTKILPQPDVIMQTKAAMGAAIEGLTK